MDLFKEFHDVFTWFYEYLRGFDPNIIQHVIPIKKGKKLVRHKQRPINHALEATIKKEVEIFSKR